MCLVCCMLIAPVNQDTLSCAHYYYYYYIRLTAFFQDILGKPTCEKGKPFWILLQQEMLG